MDAIAWGAAATVFVFTISQIIQVLTIIIRRKEEKKNTAKLLKSEIKCILKSGGLASDIRDFESFIRNSGINEINGCSFAVSYTPVYNSVLKDISNFDEGTAEMISEFYNLIARMNAFVAHFKSKEFIDAGEEIHHIMKHPLVETVKDIHRIGVLLIERIK